MRIRDLSERTGVPIPTIKFYIREGLLPPGKRTARTQADYRQEHVDRLELIKALRDGAAISIATLSRIFAAMATTGDDEGYGYLRIAVAALTPPVEIPDEEADDYAAAAETVGRLLDELGWHTNRDSSPAAELTRAIVQVRRYLPGLVDDPADLLPYARAARVLADYEISAGYDPTGHPEAALRLAVLGTALFEPIILALRKLAHVDRVRELANESPISEPPGHTVPQ